MNPLDGKRVIDRTEHWEAQGGPGRRDEELADAMYRRDLIRRRAKALELLTTHQEYLRNLTGTPGVDPERIASTEQAVRQLQAQVRGLDHTLRQMGAC